MTPDSTRAGRERAADSSEDVADVDGQSRPGVGADPAHDSSVAEQPVEDAVLRAIDEGRRRLSRRTWPLLATGVVGGVDVGTGVLALLFVEHETKSKVLAGLAFSVGFVALSLARSELFTEDFLVPVTTVFARQARLRMLLRLWVGTLLANLVGGWVFTFFIVKGFPQWQATTIEAGTHYVQLGLGVQAFSLAVLGGVVITLMTWMQHNTTSDGLRLAPAITAGFLLGGAQLNHAIVNSLLMFASLHTGHAPFGYVQWLQTAGLAAAGNIVGGVGLVTLLRLLQSPHTVQRERSRPALGVPFGDKRRVGADGGRT
jgi:formate/nitrite transporter FocA (FNT family)